MDIFLFIGQSNMAGRGEIENDETGEAAGCFLLNAGGSWEPAANGGVDATDRRKLGYNRYSTTEFPEKIHASMYSCGVAFGQRLHRLRPDIPAGLIFNARGGSPIALWTKDAPPPKGMTENLFVNTVHRTKEAMKQGMLRGIFWYQGEVDARTRTKNYLQTLQILVADLRAALEVRAEDVPFIAGELLPRYAAFNESYRTLTELIPNSAFVSGEGFVDIGDGMHLNRESLDALGVRYAEAYVSWMASAHLRQSNEKE